MFERVIKILDFRFIRTQLEEIVGLPAAKNAQTEELIPLKLTK